jgi:predicted metal-dependent phosphoesterase TrpH
LIIKEKWVLRIDAHCHTDCSDGNLTIEERITLIKASGYDAATITDHDFISDQQVERAKKAAGKMPYIPGIEFSLREEGQVIHLLGYYIDPQHPKIRKQIQRAQEVDKNLTEAMIREARFTGIKFEINDLVSSSLHTFYSLQFVKRTARELFGNDGQKMMALFHSLLKKLNLSYADFAPWPVLDAIEVIRQAGGFAVLAHPGGKDDTAMRSLGFCIAEEPLIKRYLAGGLAGIEVSHPSHSPEEKAYYSNLADKYHLLKTSGSDCHGDDPYLGPRTMGVFRDIPDDLFEKMEETHYGKS